MRLIAISAKVRIGTKSLLVVLSYFLANFRTPMSAPMQELCIVVTVFYPLGYEKKISPLVLNNRHPG
jgi:hypothetical protein